MNSDEQLQRTTNAVITWVWTVVGAGSASQVLTLLLIRVYGGMSHISSPRTDLDIWDFVTCSKCHLPFSSGPSAPPQVPFWLTECGHVICNLHLNADQSCCECGAQRIQMMPLQRELDPPMSDWFCSIPHAMDTISYSIKIAQQRDVLLRVKHEREELKNLRKTAEELRAENKQLRLYAGLDGNGSNSATNSSGKRPRMDAYNADARNLSSPRSVITPVGPNRLTLPADHQPPVLNQRSSNVANVDLKVPIQGGRPPSSRLRYALNETARAVFTATTECSLT
ncbi:hypothetical protein B0F90DRAFT_739094 [Multifurca ochricompacta]|uniref:RING-type domain-containing protein n=1 Tax=Multifurca ochricompacta TaxID=376703 RepID=A0AAD4QRV9_9AGAM|nr:hypothetical protein B0F90DRAFT_739094 [Multifurca ochricompacta]